MEQFFCPACGNAISERSVFCDICGTRVAAQPTQPTGYPPQPAYPPITQVVYVKPKVPGRGFGIASMVLGILGLLYSLSGATAILSMLDFGFYAEAFIPPLIMISVMPLLATIFGYSARKRGYRCGISNSGLTMGIIGLCAMALILMLAVLSSL